jgi:hypothetical protein
MLAHHHVFSYPLAQLDPRNLPACDTDNDLLLLINCCINFVAVELKKYFHRTVTDTLVTIHKRMILN